MKQPFTIEIRLKRQLPANFYKDCGSPEAFKKWLGITMMFVALRQPLVAQPVYLQCLNEKARLCLS